jgi:PKD repeat protein
MARTRFILIALLISSVVLLYSWGCDDLVTETIQTTIAGHPEADFGLGAGYNDSGCAPYEIQFDDKSDGPINKWTWYFGDGDSVVNDTNPIHIYESPGIYNCTLKVEDTTTEGVDIEVKSRYIVVGTIVADFGVSDTVNCPNRTVSFQTTDLGGVSRLVWDFGDSTTRTVTQELDSPVVKQYDTTGVYTVKLTAIGDCGNQEYTKTDLVRITECPQAIITLDTNRGCVPLKIKFADTASVAPENEFVSEHQWTFGNGQTSTNAVDSVTYQTADTFVVTLKIKSSNGGTDSTSDTIVVVDTTVAAFTTLTPTAGCEVPSRQFQVKFQNESTGELDSFLWQFGDGDTSWNDPTPIHAYDPGRFSVSLTAWGECGADSIEEIDLVAVSSNLSSPDFEIREDPGDILITNDTLVENQSYKFYDISTAAGAKRWLWSFGAGGTDESDSASFYTYNDTTGDFSVRMTVYNDCDSLDIVKTITVLPETPAK